MHGTIIGCILHIYSTNIVNVIKFKSTKDARVIDYSEVVLMLEIYKYLTKSIIK